MVTECLVYTASAFCKNDTGGNKAGIVLYKMNLSANDKKRIAKKLGYAETAFINDSDKADFKIEFFTPAEEVPLCGHATIASFGILKHLGKLKKKHYTIETKSGILEIVLENDEIFMEQNTPIFYDEISPAEVKRCFSLEGCLDTNRPILIASTGLKDILVPIKSEYILNKLNPDFNAITKISKKYNVIGMHLYAIGQEKTVCRNFAPLYDVNEEAATGTSNCALAGLLFTKLDVKKEQYMFEQGYSLGSPSIIKVKICSSDNKRIDKIFVGGKSQFIEAKYITLS